MFTFYIECTHIASAYQSISIIVIILNIPTTSCLSAVMVKKYSAQLYAVVKFYPIQSMKSLALSLDGSMTVADEPGVQ